MLRLSNSLPRRAGECRRLRPCAPARDARTPWCAAPPSPGSVLLVGGGLPLDARRSCGGDRAAEDAELEEGEIPADGELAGCGRPTSSSAGGLSPLRGLRPCCSSPAAGSPAAREDKRVPLVQSTCSTFGRAVQSATQAASEEAADPNTSGRSMEDIAENVDCNGKEDSLVLDSQGREDAKHGSCRSNDVEKQRTVPALIEKNQSSSGIDEDATLKAMRMAARRNLDGETLGMQLTDQVLQPVDSSPARQAQSGYPFGDTLAFELGYPSAGGGAAFSCSRVAALGAGGHGIFFSGTWVAF